MRTAGILDLHPSLRAMITYSPQSGHSILDPSLYLTFVNGGGELDADSVLAQAGVLEGRPSVRGVYGYLKDYSPVLQSHRLVVPQF